MDARRVGPLSKAGFVCAGIAGAAILGMTILAGSLSGVPGGTVQDYAKNCGSLLFLVAAAALTLTGGALSFADWHRAPSKGLSRPAAATALALNAAPWILVLGWEILS